MRDDIIGKYRVVDRIGHGGMGTVYRAWDPVLKRDVAVKVLSGVDLDQESLRRFEREAQAVARLHHPNIVVVHDFGNQDGTPYLVMEYLEGIGLDRAIHERSPYSLNQKLRVVVDACRALEHAHGRGVIHRDIKPANLWITNEGVGKVLDFGIALVEGEELTTCGGAFGTPYYVSPEAVRGQALDARSDLFSLTVTLYEWLTFEKPFGTGTPVEIIARIADGEPCPIETVLPRCPPTLAAVIRTGLQKSRERRFPTAAAMASAVAAVVEVVEQDAAAGSAPAALTGPDAGDGHRPGLVVQKTGGHGALAHGWRWATGAGVLVVVGTLAVMAGVSNLKAPRRLPGEESSIATSTDGGAAAAPRSGIPSRPSGAETPAKVLTAPPVSLSGTVPERQSKATKPAGQPAEPPSSGAGLASPEGRGGGSAITPSEPEPGVEERGLVLPVASTMMVSLVHELWSDKVGVGEEFDAVLAEPLKVGGTVVAPVGTPVVGNVDAVGRLDRPDSRPFILLSITRLGEPINLPIRTASYKIVAPAAERGVDVSRLVIAIGAGAGVGALVAGKSGAVVGAGAGAAASALSRGVRSSEYRVTAPLPFRLAQRVVIRPSVPKEPLP